VSVIIGDPTVGQLSLRNEPVQARSTARLAGLLDAAAAVIDELGYERLTTAMVAERAGASIGTVYRYFPDRIAVLQALAARNLERTLATIGKAIADTNHPTWREALGAGFGAYVDAFRSEPGFRSLRVGDVIDLQPRPTEHSYKWIVAQAMHAALVQRFETPRDADTKFAFEVAVEMTDAMASRAFTFDTAGEAAFLDAGREAVFALLETKLDTPN